MVNSSNYCSILHRESLIITVSLIIIIRIFFRNEVSFQGVKCYIGVPIIVKKLQEIDTWSNQSVYSFGGGVSIRGCALKYLCA